MVLFFQMATKERELHMTYNDSLAEMKGLLSAQKRVGAQWKGEMEILTKRFQVLSPYICIYLNMLKYYSTVFVIYSVERFRESRVCARPAARASFAEPFYRIYGGNGMFA